MQMSNGNQLADELANPVFDSPIGAFNPPGIIPNGKNTLGLKFLDSALFGINCVQNSKGVYGCYVLCRRPYCSGFESDVCFVTFINFIDAAHATDPRRNVTRREQKWQRVAGPQRLPTGVVPECPLHGTGPLAKIFWGVPIYVRGICPAARLLLISGFSVRRISPLCAPGLAVEFSIRVHQISPKQGLS